MNASVNRRENSIFALNPPEESSLISINGNGTPNSGPIICRFGQPAWHRWRKLRRSLILRSTTDSCDLCISGVGIVACSSSDVSRSATNESQVIEHGRTIFTQRLTSIRRFQTMTLYDLF